MKFDLPPADNRSVHNRSCFLGTVRSLADPITGVFYIYPVYVSDRIKETIATSRMLQHLGDAQRPNRATLFVPLIFLDNKFEHQRFDGVVDQIVPDSYGLYLLVGKKNLELRFNLSPGSMDFGYGLQKCLTLTAKNPKECLPFRPPVGVPIFARP